MPSDPFAYSFSGADARVFCYFEHAPHLIRPLDSVHTISVSIHEAKGPARALGYRGIKGMARGVRTIAGSLILTVVNDHPLRPLLNQWTEAEQNISPGWSFDRDLVGTGHIADSYNLSNRLSTLLPPFNLAVQYVSENPGRSITNLNINSFREDSIAQGAGLLLRHVEFIDDGIVTSTNDIVTEITLSFVAMDYKPLSAYDIDSINARQFEALMERVDETSRAIDQLADQIRAESGLPPISGTPLFEGGDENGNGAILVEPEELDIRTNLNDTSAEDWLSGLLANL